MPTRHALSLLLILATWFAIFPAHSYAGSSPTDRAKTQKHHKVVFQVSDDDPKKWNLTLLNAKNVQAELGANHVAIEIVVYGPAIEMLRIESEVAPRVDEAIKSGIRLIACQNTMRGMNISADDMLPDLHYTRTGVVYLMKKQEQGYAYIRP